MQRHLLIFVTMLLVLVSAAGANDQERQAELLDEVLRLSHEGVPDQIIIKHIYSMDFVFEFVADDIIELRSLGVSDEVLEALIDTALVEDDADDRRDRDYAYVRISPGYYSPWYYFPYAWGYYYDPFPTYYSHHYYPFHYRFHASYGNYGWCGSTYYYAYHGRRGHHGGQHRRSPYNVATYRESRRVYAPNTSPGHVAPAPRVRENPAPRRVVSEQLGRERIRTPRSSYRADEVRRPVRPETRVTPNRVRDAKAPTTVREKRPVPKRVERPAVRPRGSKAPSTVKKRSQPRRVERPRATRRPVRELKAPVRVKEPKRNVSRPAKRSNNAPKVVRPTRSKSPTIQRPSAPTRPQRVAPSRPATRSRAPKISARKPKSR